MLRVLPPQPEKHFDEGPPSCFETIRYDTLSVKEITVSGKRILAYIATLGPLGFAPVAPGTAGSLFAWLVCLVLRPQIWLLLTMALSIFILGIYAADEAERRLGEKDSSHIIIDEVTGYMVAIIFLSPTILNLTAALIIFRLFDILKPPPIRYFEQRISGGLGVMFDDVLAGVYTNLVLQVFILIKG